MVRVMASGVFDLLHTGHLHYLEEARKLGDELVVVVAKDSTVRREKHDPITPEDVRRELVDALKPVDKALLGKEGDMFEIVEEIRPDVIALGHDQGHDEEAIKAELRKRGLDAEVVRLSKLGTDLDGTRKIIQKVVAWYQVKAQLDAIEGGK
jgi:FAD synthetase